MFDKIKNRKIERKANEKEYFEKLQSDLQKQLNDYTDDLKNVTNEKTKELLEREIKEAKEFLEGVNSTLQNDYK
jgi:hypothetical protein